MSQSSDERPPKNRPAFSTQPPQKSTIATGRSADPPGTQGKLVYLLDSMTVKEVAAALGLKPFKVIGDLIELKHFKTADDNIDFGTASLIARKHGYRPEKPPPGMLVL